VSYTRRHQHSDLYLLLDIRGFVHCIDCSLLTLEEQSREPSGHGKCLGSLDDALVHLATHRAHGDLVPLGLEDELKRDEVVIAQTVLEAVKNDTCRIENAALDLIATFVRGKNPAILQHTMTLDVSHDTPSP